MKIIKVSKRIMKNKLKKLTWYSHGSILGIISNNYVYEEQSNAKAGNKF